MKNGVRDYKGVIQQLWMFFMAAVFMASANALVLGDIQVDSALGRPLSARIAFVELTDADALQFKVRLADIGDYKKLGLQYPDNHKFHFQLVNEPGKQPFIRVSTQRSVDDPFVNLLIEISSASGRLIKAYTFLLDPASNSPTVTVDDTQQTATVTELKPVSAASARSDTVQSGAIKSGHKKHHHSTQASAARRVQDDRRQMKLSMSLSISRYDPSAPVSTNSDALQEELIAKEKLLNDLKLQIGEMQLVIQDLKDKRTDHAASAAGNEMTASGVSAVAVASSVAASAMVASSGVNGVEARKPKAAPVVQPAGEFNWKKPVATLASLLTVMSCMFLYRWYMNKPSHGMFDDLHDDAAVDATFGKPVQTSSFDADTAQSHEESVNPLSKSAQDSLPLKFDKSGMSFSAPASSEQKGPSIVPPEYTVLMEANKYLRAGNDDLAEGALIRAIEINPNNAYGYLALLKIYERRGDKSGFERMTEQLRQTGDEVAFKEAAVMGYRLNPENPLYGAGKTA